MRKILFSNALLSLFLLSINAAQAGIVFKFGSNITQERRVVLEAAAAEIEGIIDFKENVIIDISFANLECDNFSAVLGSAGPVNAFGDFPGAPQSDVWYVGAQAADLGSAEAKAVSSHIAARFNNKLGQAGCLQGVSWYFGTDHNPGPGQIDFLSTAVHEFMHGLGFLTFIG